MANKQLFASLLQNNLATTATNRAGGKSYGMSPKQALAQYASTGSLNGTFYASAETQLDEILALCNNQYGFIDTKFIAQTALYAREKAFMKDVPALLVAILATRGETEFLKAVFPHVVDNAKIKSCVRVQRVVNRLVHCLNV
jgi:60 kDa SS-A/Ro ribonucleoprotein